MIFMPVGLLLPFVITIAICDFASVYAAYPVVIKYMMDPDDAKSLIERTHLNDEESVDEQDLESIEEVTEN